MRKAAEKTFYFLFYFHPNFILFSILNSLNFNFILSFCMLCMPVFSFILFFIVLLFIRLFYFIHSLFTSFFFTFLLSMNSALSEATGSHSLYTLVLVCIYPQYWSCLPCTTSLNTAFLLPWRWRQEVPQKCRYLHN